MCVCVCVCVCEGERSTKWGLQTEIICLPGLSKSHNYKNDLPAL